MTDHDLDYDTGAAWEDIIDHAGDVGALEKLGEIISKATDALDGINGLTDAAASCMMAAKQSVEAATEAERQWYEDEQDKRVLRENIVGGDKLAAEVEEQWPYLRVPEKAKVRPATTVGTRLRRAAEEYRASRTVVLLDDPHPEGKK